MIRTSTRARPNLGRVGASGGFVVAMFAFLWLVPAAVKGQSLTAYSVYSAFQTPLASWGLVALAVMLTMLVGELDFSVAGSFALGGVIAVSLGGSSPLLGVVAAIGAGVASGAVQGSVIVKWGLNSVAVTLGGLFALLGLASAITHGKTRPYDNVTFAINFDKSFAGVLSWHSVVTIALFLALAAVMKFTRLGQEIRATGGYRRGARVAGVGVQRVVLGAYVTAGGLAATAGALASYSLAAAIPNPGFGPLIFGVTAGVLAGFSLAGGTGDAVSGLAAVIALSFLQAAFGLLGSPGWVVSVVTGSVLLVVTTTTAPEFRDGVRTALRAARSEWPRRSAGTPRPRRGEPAER